MTNKKLDDNEQAMADYEINEQPHNDYDYIDASKKTNMTKR